MLFRSSAYLCFPFGLGDGRTITATHRGRMETYDREEHPIIDEGLYAVYRSTRQSDGKVFAMKRVSPNPIRWKLGAPSFSKEESRQYIWNEAAILNLAFLRCKYIVELQDLGGYDLDPSIMMEAPDQTLRTMISANPDFMSADNGRIMSAHILSAVRYINCNKIIHGDINFDNIFIFNTNPLTFKLAGLGLAIHTETPDALTKDCSMAALRAPEVVPRDQVFWQAQRSFNEKIDVYSFGVILYHTMTKGPYPDFTKCVCATDRYERRVQWKPDATLLRPYYSASKDFIEWILQKDPAGRPTAEQCLQHRWLTWSNGSSHNSR